MLFRFLHEIAYLHALADSRAGSELCKRTYLHIVFYNGIVCLNIVELYVVADGAVFNVGVSSDGAAFPYGRISLSAIHGTLPGTAGSDILHRTHWRCATA